MTLPNGRDIDERHFDLPALPVGRHRLEVDGVDCALTIAPPEAFRHKAASAGAGSASPRSSMRCAATRRDQGIGDFTALGSAAAAAAKPRRRLFRREPAAYAVRRTTATAPAPTTLPTGASSIRSSSTRSDGDGLPRRRGMVARRLLDARRVTRGRRQARDRRLRGGLERQAHRAARPLRGVLARAARRRPRDPVFAEFDASSKAGGEALAPLRVFEAIRARAQRRVLAALAGRICATPTRRRSPPRRRSATTRFASPLFCQWLADRQLGRGGRARPRGGASISASIAISRSARRRTARKLVARGRTRARRRRRRAARPVLAQRAELAPAAARSARRRARRLEGLRAIYRANMRHAGMLRIDHAMGLTRLFVIPDGAKPAEGAYVAYPVDDLIGQIALESQRNRMHGGRRGPRHRARRLPRQADQAPTIHGMRVLCFERDGAQRAAARVYPPLSVACVTTHDLPTLAGWWRRRRHRRAALARFPDLGQGRRGDRPPARGQTRPHRRSCRSRPHRLGPER